MPGPVSDLGVHSVGSCLGGTASNAERNEDLHVVVCVNRKRKGVALSGPPLGSGQAEGAW